ncbi:MAG: tRNA (adenosine(37)-N6)-threonylcarbamoyltransferase complex dimerization subunit type 1 TsaB [Candidatus Thioglobus sp.]|jgi:tRNA threonylcarbamoyladenosine biosynthesis protein TsaB|nr:tRNA (adenosine(37)-N6)-threonylcarbamoyltransferase complex dimerization subunit type 1 TsaB [Candidatus Thioglobus sp.]|tara:strand:- start:546 stop:1202 length:657 start_codon:yes stop_codon:yes gene_type:complete
MNILAIDTCTEVASITLSIFGKKTSRVILDMAKSSGQILMLCDEVFSETGVELNEVDVIVYTKGPGAFTGVRMCVGVVQGLSLASGIPTMGFSTLELLGFKAASRLNSQKIAAAIDARMGEVYWAIYEHGLLCNERICGPDNVDKLSEDYIGVGSGWGSYKESLAERSNIKQIESDFYPESVDLIELFLLATENGQVATFELPQPTYLRNNVAQKSLK